MIDPASFCRKPIPVWRAPFLGFATQASNPRTAVVHASVFASLLPNQVSRYVLVALPILVFTIETIWYSIVAIVLSSPLPRARYLAAKAWIDRCGELIMFLLGAKLIGAAHQA